MNPKMTLKDAADFLGLPSRKVFKRLLDDELPYTRNAGAVCFGYPTARQLFRLSLKPKAVSFQIVKGGTGKTSLAYAVAVRANLYGLKVLCIDLDQQGNLTSSFGVDAESVPVMVDILAENYTFAEAITRVYPGMDLLASRMENSLLDDVIKLKYTELDKVYITPLEKLKEQYDLIVIDCPPSLGQSAAAMTLAVDQVIAPVVAESYALSGLKATQNAIQELEENYNTKIALDITINKYDSRSLDSQQAKQILSDIKSHVHASTAFANAVIRGESLFDTVKSNQAKRDVDQLTRAILGIEKAPSTSASMLEYSVNMEELFA